MEPSGKYYVSVLVEIQHEQLQHTDGQIGLDLGIKDLCTTLEGIRYKNPKTIKNYEKKLAKLQRQLSHKEKRAKIMRNKKENSVML